MMGTIRSMISFFRRTPSSSTHQSNSAHPPPHFPISEEISDLVTLMSTFFSWSCLITLSTHSNRQVGRQMILKLWHAGTSQLPEMEVF